MVEKEFQRTTFDARIQYYNLLSTVLQEGKKAAVLSDLRSWYRCLHITYNMVCPYIEPAENKLLRERLFSLRKRMMSLETARPGNSGVYFQRQLQLDKSLMELDEAIHKAAKRMMLPLENTTGGDFDMERFMRESDLSS